MAVQQTRQNAPAADSFVRRCRWCEKRIGATRFFVDEEWMVVLDPKRFFGDARFTDTCCPECQAKMEVDDDRLLAAESQP